MKKTTLLVDGQSLLKQSFHGNKDLFTSFGYIGAIVTFYQIVRKLIKEFHCTKVIIFWDGKQSGKLRYNIYPGYKESRDKDWHGDEGIILSDKDIKREETVDKSLLMQRARIQQYAEELFIRQVEDPVCEADDCIAYYTTDVREDDELCIVYTNDRDALQLINKNVQVYLANKKSIVTEKTFSLLYFDYHLKNSALIKAIEGCTSDEIEGVEGLAEKGLLKYFPELRTMEVTFDHIYDRAVEINKSRKKPLVALQNLIDGRTSTKSQNEKEDKLNEDEGKGKVRPKNLFDTILTGKHLFELNYKLVNLKEPFLTDECREEILNNTMSPLSDEDRGGKNLMRLMYEDGFINSIPRGPEGYKDFLIEFLPVVKTEKEKYQNYLNGID